MVAIGVPTLSQWVDIAYRGRGPVAGEFFGHDFR